MHKWIVDYNNPVITPKGNKYWNRICENCKATNKIINIIYGKDGYISNYSNLYKQFDGSHYDKSKKCIIDKKVRLDNLKNITIKI